MPKTKFLLICLLIFVSTSECCTQSKVRIFVYPQNAIIKVDNENVKNGSILSLSNGNHEIRAWAQKHNLKDSTFFVSNDAITVLRLKLDISEEFLEYERNIKEYRRDIFTKRVAPVVLSSIGSFGIYSFGYLHYRKKALRVNRKAKGDYRIYSLTNDYDTAIEARDRFRKNEEEFLKLRQRFYVCTGLSICSAIVGNYFQFRSSKRKHPLSKPRYEEHNKLSFNSLGITDFGGNGLGISLNLNLH